MVVWHNWGKRFDPAGTGTDAFGDHVRAMRSFRQAHQPFGSGISPRETGGTRRGFTAGGVWLAYRTEPERFSKN